MMFKKIQRLVLKVLLLIAIMAFINIFIVQHRLHKFSQLNVSLEENNNPFTKPSILLRPHVIKQRNVETQHEIPATVGEKKDWENYALIKAESKRVGLGERGLAAHIQDQSKKKLEKTMLWENGFNALLSDMISVNRSVPDVRKEKCRGKPYLAKLPTASVVITCYNEHFNTLLRTLHSIVNRTPAELLHEVIIVDDKSDREELKKQLDDYVQKNFPGVVTVVHLPRRSGLTVARLTGARKASGDVLVFFDSHIECNHNWLPPLLEPIALNPKISTCPTIDSIHHETFAYDAGAECMRGYFEWNMAYYRLHPSKHLPGRENTAPCHNPVMMGGLFAINRNFFWELGGYDEGLEVWGGEQYELSFKIWMCGGMVLDIPCSRVAHVFRGPMARHRNVKNHKLVARNYKRIAEVWMDEYKKYVYDRKPEVYHAIDPGDLTAQHENRKRLKCKSFKWFLEEVAPELLKTSPLVPINFASGAIQSVAYPQYCLDTYFQFEYNAVGLFYCAKNKTHPQPTQYWELAPTRDLRNKHNERCLDVYGTNRNVTVWMWKCHNMGGNQFWYYDRKQQWLVHGRHGTRCMEAMMVGDKRAVYVNLCNPSNLRMKWRFGTVNHTALDAFYKTDI